MHIIIYWGRTMSKIRIFVIDNVDSFIFNLVDLLYAITPKITIYRNTANADGIFAEMQQSQQLGEKPLLLLSPGPKRPSDIPLLEIMMGKCKGLFPILGVCLGHQAIIAHYGGKVVQCDEIMHGKKSTATVTNHKIFERIGTPDTLEIGRYHSLIGVDLPDNALTCLMTVGDIVMGVIDDKNMVVGYQFHPESILTPNGEQLLHTTVQYMTDNQHKIYTGT